MFDATLHAPCRGQPVTMPLLFFILLIGAILTAVLFLRVHGPDRRRGDAVPAPDNETSLSVWENEGGHIPSA